MSKTKKQREAETKGPRPTPPFPVPTPEAAGQREGSVNLIEAHIGVWEETRDWSGVRETFRLLLELLRGRGWALEEDPDTIAHYSVLRPWRWVGRKSSLCMHAETSGRTVKIEFWSGTNHKNPNGARYDFDRFSLMTRKEQMLCVVEMSACVRAFMARGYTLPNGSEVDADKLLLHVLRRQRHREVDKMIPRQTVAGVTYDIDPVAKYQKSWGSHTWGREVDAQGFETYERSRKSGWPYKDRDGIPLTAPGEEKYLRLYNGRIARVRVYPNMNNMVAAYHGCGCAYVNASDLLSCTDPQLLPRRVFYDTIEKQEKRLRAELEKSLKKSDYARVEVLGRVLKRFAAKTKTPTKET